MSFVKKNQTKQRPRGRGEQENRILTSVLPGLIMKSCKYRNASEGPRANSWKIPLRTCLPFWGFYMQEGVPWTRRRGKPENRDREREGAVPREKEVPMSACRLHSFLLPPGGPVGTGEAEALKALMPLFFSYVIQNNNKYKEYLIHMVIPQVSLNPQKLKFFLKNSFSGGGGGLNLILSLTTQSSYKGSHSRSPHLQANHSHTFRSRDHFNNHQLAEPQVPHK